MIPVLIFLAFLWMMYNYIMDGIVAPTLRRHVRHRVFAIRDELRVLHASVESDEQKEACAIVEAYANNAVYLVSEATFGSLIASRSRAMQDKTVDAKADRLIEVIFAHEDIRKCVDKIYYRVTQSATINCHNWTLCMLPIIMLFVNLPRWFASKRWVGDALGKLLATRQRDQPLDLRYRDHRGRYAH